MTDPEPILVTRSIHKRFPGVHALDDVSISVYPGEVLGMSQGRLTADIPRAEATEERIMTAAMGQPSLVA